MLTFGNEEFWEEDEEEALESCAALESINRWLLSDTVKNYGPLSDLTSCTYQHGAEMNANLWGGGFKHFDIEAFMQVVAEQPWHDRANVRLFLKGEEDEVFTIYRLKEEQGEIDIVE